jgi:hypothetical protein
MEGQDNVDNPDAAEIKPDADGKHPETVPWNKYVGIKESLGGKLEKAQEQVKDLEEKLRNAPNAEEFGKIKGELDTTKAKLTEVETELGKSKEKTVSELRETLKGKGVPAEKVDKMSEIELRAANDVLGDRKPAPDLGSGGGSGELKGSHQELAKRAYS